MVGSQMIHSPSCVPTWALRQCTGLISSFWYNRRVEFPPKLCLLTLKSSCVNLLPTQEMNLLCHRAAFPAILPLAVLGNCSSSGSCGMLECNAPSSGTGADCCLLPSASPTSISLVNLAGNLIVLVILLKTPELPKAGCKPKE